MAINKMQYGDKVLDLSTDTFNSADQLTEGVTAHGRNGVKITGNIPMSEVPLQSDKMDAILALLKTKKAGGGGNAPVYKLDEPVVFTDRVIAETIDTGIDILSENKDFYIAVDFKFEKSEGNEQTVIGTYYQDSTYGWTYISLASNTYSKTFLCRVANAEYGTIKLANDYEMMSRHTAGIARIGNKVFFTLDNQELYEHTRTLNNVKQSRNIFIGSNGNNGNCFRGTIYGVYIWKGDIDETTFRKYMTTASEEMVLKGYSAVKGDNIIEGSYRDNQAIADLIASGNISVTTLSGNMFDGNNKITDAIFPNVTALNKSYVFRNCNKLEHIEMSAVTGTIGSYTITDNPHLKTALFENCVRLGTGAFRNNPQLSTLVLKNKLYGNLDSYCLDNHPSLELETVVDFAELTGIGSQSLDYGILPIYVSFPKLTTLAAYGIRGCKVVKTLDFSVLTSAGAQAFQAMDDHLENIIIRTSSVCTYVEGSATNDPKHPNLKIYVPQALIDDYKVATNWARLADKFVPIEGSEFE